MALDLTQLHKLHLIDAGLVEIQMKAASLGVAKKYEAEVAAALSASQALEKAFHVVHGEQKDLELTNKQISDKIKSIDQQLFGGKVTNAKEIENLEHQRAGLKATISANEDLLLEMMEGAVPAAEKQYLEAKKAYESVAKQYEVWRQKAVVLKQELAKKQQDLLAKRPEIEKTVPAIMLARYDSIRKSRGGIGMADITREQTCGECGNHVAEKSVQIARAEQLTVCDDCGRILYWHGL